MHIWHDILKTYKFRTTDLNLIPIYNLQFFLVPTLTSMLNFYPMNRIISFLLSFLLLVAIAIIALPWVLFFKTEPFSGRLLFTIIFSVAGVEKVWSTFFKTPDRVKADAKKDWTTVSVGYSYIAIWYIAIFDYYFRLEDTINPYIAGIGLIIFITSIILRYWVLHHLGHQWTVHVDENVDDRHLIRSGPYRYARHPLYAESFLEAAGIALVFASLPAFLMAALIFIPLEVHRAYFEENYLKKIFGEEYNIYKSQVWAFFPLPFRKNKS